MSHILEEGDQVYLEIDRPAIACLPSFRKKRLLRLGFDDTAFYWPRPSFGNAEMLMPLGDKRVQRFYLNRLFLCNSFLKRALRLTLKLLSASGLFVIALPRYAVIACRVTEVPLETDASTPYLLKQLLQNWTALEAGLSTPRKIQWLVLNGGVKEQSKIVAPCWLDNQPEPAVVLKFQRDPLYNSRLESEYRVLCEVQPYLPAGQAQVPRPYGSLLVGERRVTVETAAGGKPLASYMQEHPRRHSKILAQFEPLSLWLTALHANSARSASETELETLMLGPLRSTAHDLGLSPRAGRAAAKLLGYARKLWDESPLPLTYNHNDLGTPNVLSTDNGTFAGVIDWESGGFGWPATDLIYFLERFSYIQHYSKNKSNDLVGFREMFFTQSSVAGPSVAQQWLMDYCHRLGISTRWLPVLFGLCWAMHARNEKQQVEDEARLRRTEVHARDDTTQDTGHFRRCLQFYLEHMASLVVAPVKMPEGFAA
jgi:aminoglycoside phosphotransferase (APT) family kinase protein